MKEKYHNLINFENNVIKPFILRILKENFSNFKLSESSKFDVFTFFQNNINKIQLPIEVVNDILNIICDVGLIEKDFLIQEIYYSQFKSKGISYNNVLDCIYEYSPYKLLTNPVDWLIFWSNSKKGSRFYVTLCENVNKHLNTKKIIKRIVNNGCEF